MENRKISKEIKKILLDHNVDENLRNYINGSLFYIRDVEWILEVEEVILIMKTSFLLSSSIIIYFKLLKTKALMDAVAASLVYLIVMTLFLIDIEDPKSTMLYSTKNNYEIRDEIMRAVSENTCINDGVRVLICDKLRMITKEKDNEDLIARLFAVIITYIVSFCFFMLSLITGLERLEQ